MQRETLTYLLVGAAALFIVKRLTSRNTPEGGDSDLSYASAEEVEKIPFSPDAIYKLNPRFATEPKADRAYAIRKLGGKVVNPINYPYTLAGFQSFLSDSGVNRTWSSAYELAKANHPSIAAKYGYTLFLPPQVWWPKGAALGLLQNRLRELVGEGIVINNWWRPKGYNEDPGVGGAPKGDHPDGDALDLNFKSEASRWRGCKYVYDLMQSEPNLGISLGVYASAGTLHVGIQSAQGSRTWDYSQGKGTGARVTAEKIQAGLRRTGVA
jgi:hypothetical protein